MRGTLDLLILAGALLAAASPAAAQTPRVELGHSSGCMLVSLLATDPRNRRHMTALTKMASPDDPTFHLLVDFILTGVLPKSSETTP